MYSATQNQIKLDPAENPSGTWQLMAAPISYSELYGSTKTFTTNDELVILDSSTIAHTTQFTLIVHRVNLASEPIDCGINTKRITRSTSGDIIYDSSNPQYNHATVMMNQLLVGIMGYNGFTIGEVTTGFANQVKKLRIFPQSVFTHGETSVTCNSNGFIYGASHFEDTVTAFYVVDCDQSCESCFGVLETQCLSCPVGLKPLNGGVCSCPDGKYGSSDGTNFICLDCDASCLTCSGSAT